MIFKNSLAASGYIVSLFGGGYIAYDYLQDKTIGHLLLRVGTPYTKPSEFKTAYISLKSDSQFKADIGINNSSLNDEQGGKLLNKWCIEISNLEATEENIKKFLKIAQNYCNFPKKGRVINQINNNALNLRNVKKTIASKGLEKGGHLFVTFFDNSKKLGRAQRFSYCWDTSKKDWVSSKGEEDCRGKYGAS